MPQLRILPSLTVLFAFLLPPSVGSADLVRRTAGEFFAKAKTIEILRIIKVDRGRLTAQVLSSLRGAARPGTSLTIHAPMVTLTAGQEVLHACNKLFCLWGLPRGQAGKGAYFEVHTDFLGHATVHVVPGLIQRSALPLLAAGKKAPPLCLELNLQLTDSPATHARLTARIDASTGEGTIGAAEGARGKLARRWLPSSRKAQLLLREGRSSIGVVSTGGSWLSFHGPLPVWWAGSGCYALPTWPESPFARTPRLLAPAFAGKAKRFTLAKGSIRIRRPSPGLAPGRYALRVTFSPNQGLRFVCALLAEGAPHQGYSKLARQMLTFPLARPKHYLGLVAGFARSPMLLPRLARKLFQKKKLRWPVRAHGLNDAGKVVGEATLVHVADPR